MPNIAIASRKGGVGKTTTTSNLAVCFAEQLRLRVLAIDIDPQGHTTKGLGIEVDPAIGSGAYHVLRYGAPISSVVSTTPWGVDVLTGGGDLRQADEYLRSEGGAEFHLRQALEQRALEADPYDVVLMDCPPQFGRLSVAALLAASSVICPVTLDALALDGLAELHAEIRKLVRLRINPELRLGAVLEMRTRPPSKTSAGAKIIHAELVKSASGLLLRGTIRESDHLAPAWNAGVPITTYKGTSNGARDYRALAHELRERGLA
jgi:chromosome partitioning protein